MTSCAGHVDGKKKRIDNNTSLYSSGLTKTLQTESKLSCATAEAKHSVVKVTHSVPSPFNEIMICALFISVNAIQNFLLYELIPVIHGYDQHMSKVDLHLPGL